MTDNEIIQAMNYCCGNIEKDGECKEDMCYQATLPEDRDGDTRWCRQWLMKDALDLIKCQKAEIERLEKELTEYKLRLKMSECTVDEIKSESVKEFAEQLKKRFYLLGGRCVVDIPQINNLVKVMTEVEK